MKFFSIKTFLVCFFIAATFSLGGLTGARIDREVVEVSSVEEQINFAVDPHDARYSLNLKGRQISGSSGKNIDYNKDHLTHQRLIQEQGTAKKEVYSSEYWLPQEIKTRDTKQQFSLIENYVLKQSLNEGFVLKTANLSVDFENTGYFFEFGIWKGMETKYALRFSADKVLLLSEEKDGSRKIVKTSKFSVGSHKFKIKVDERKVSVFKHNEQLFNVSLHRNRYTWISSVTNLNPSAIRELSFEYNDLAGEQTIQCF